MYHSIKVTFLLLAMILLGIITAAQNTAEDSLRLLLPEADESKKIELYIELSGQLLNNDTQKSLNYAGKALDLAKKQQKKIQLAKAQNLIAKGYHQQLRYQAALEYYGKALESYPAGKYITEKAEILKHKADAHKSLSEFDKAEENYKKSLQIALDLQDSLQAIQLYNRLGIIYRLTNRFEESLSNHQSAIFYAKSLKKDDQMAESYNYKGSLYWNNSQLDSALKYYRKGLEIYRRIDEMKGEAHILNNIGLVLRDQGDYSKAIEYHKKSLSIQESVKNKQGEAQTLNYIGSSYLRINSFDKALEFYQSSLRIRQEINQLPEVGKSLNNIALVHLKKQDYARADSMSKEALKIFKRIGNKQLVANTFNTLGNIQLKLKNFESALNYYLQALQIRKEIGDKTEIAGSLNNIGIIYDNIGSYEKALDFYLKSLSYKKEIGDIRELAFSYQLTGNTHLKAGNYDEALNYYKDALKYRKEIGDQTDIARSLRSISVVHSNRGESKKALKNFQDAIALYTSLHDSLGLSHTYNEMGNHYLAVNKHNSALDCFQRAKEYLANNRSPFLDALLTRKIGEIQIFHGNPKEGLKNIKSSVAAGKNLSNLEMLKQAYNALYRYYKELNTDSALVYFMQYTSVKDSLEKQFNNQRLLEIQMNYELERSQEELEKAEDINQKLSDQTKEKDLQLHKQKIIRNLLLIIIILILSLVFLFYIQVKQRKKTNLLLQDKYDEIERSNKLLSESEKDLKKLNATKDKFFSIMAHDLKNPFNALHGLTGHIAGNFETLDREELKESISIIHDSAEELMDLLENLLHWSRSQRGKMLFKPTRIDLQEIIKKNISLQKMNAEKKNISIDNKVPEPCPITADEDMLTAIIRNLLSNAIKFSYPNSTVTLDFAEKDESFMMRVIDRGMGMTQETMNKLFRLDVHYSTKGTSEEQGTGLGLILCHEFVEKHGGKIDVESKLGEGSTFTITIPKKQL